MSAQATISVGTFPEFSWIRAEGKGNFLAGPELKACADAEVQKGCQRIVVDLEACQSVDSTFMGALVTIAKTSRTKVGKRCSLEIADANTDNAKAMTDLGLAKLLTINPEEADWQERKHSLREDLHLNNEVDGAVDKGDFVLNAHKELVQAFPENADQFSNLISMLEKQQTVKDRS